jgi:hypothetical protein
MIMELANIYGHVIDIVYEIRQGDEFIVTFEKRYLDGEFIEYGNIIAAEFINDGERYVAIRYTDTAGDTGYYDESGVSLRKAFLRAPLNFRRISSNFKLARKHPVLGLMRAHPCGKALCGINRYAGLFYRLMAKSPIGHAMAATVNWC